MNKLSKDKRDKLILTVLLTAGVLGALYTFVLGGLKEKLNEASVQLISTKDKLAKAERMVGSASIIEADLLETQKQLARRQKDMAPEGQYYYWFLKLLDQFRKEEGLETNFILDITQPEFVAVGMYPVFPFEAASFGVRVSGSFHEIGRFLADFENRFPYLRIQDLQMAPEGELITGAFGAPGDLLPAPVPSDNGKIVAEFKVVALIKPGTT